MSEAFDASSISLEQRQKLSDLYEIRGQLAMRNMEAFRLKSALLTTPNKENEEALEEYLEKFVRPLLRQQQPLMQELMPAVIDRDRAKEMMPMIIMIVSQVVNIRLFIELSGFDLTVEHPIISMLKQTLESDMPNI